MSCVPFVCPMSLNTRLCVFVGTLVLSAGASSAAEPPLKTRLRSLRSSNPEVRQTAIRSLLAPYEGVPVEQLDLLNHTEEGSKFLVNAKPLVSQITALLRHRDAKVANAAMVLLTRMGTHAQAAAPAICHLANNEKKPQSIRWQAAQTLFFVMPETKPVLCKILPRLDSKATFFTMYTTTDCKQCIESAERRVWSMYGHMIAMQMVNSGHTQVEVPCLINTATRARTRTTRAIAATVLAILASEVPLKVPGASALLRDSGVPHVRKMAAIAILHSRQTSRLTAAMIRYLRLDKDDRDEIEHSVRDSLELNRKAHNELVMFARDDPTRALPAFGYQIQFGRGPARREAIRVIKDVGPAAKPVVPLLKKMLKHEDAETGRLAADALAKIAPETLKRVSHCNDSQTSCQQPTRVTTRVRCKRILIRRRIRIKPCRSGIR